MANLDFTTGAHLVKRAYAQALQKLTEHPMPFLDRVKKVPVANGDGYIRVSIHTGDGNSRSKTKSTANTNASALVGKQFAVQVVRNFAVAAVDGLFLEIGKKDGAIGFADSASLQIERKLRRMKEDIARECWGDGTGKVATVDSGSALTGTTLTLDNPEDVFLFQEDDILSFASSSNVARSGTVTVAAVNEDAGTLTLDENLNTISGLAGGDLVFKSGDQGQTAIQGVPAYIPTTAPGATSFLGVDRSVDVNRLGGLRVTGSGAPTRETLIKAAARVFRAGGVPKSCYMNPTDWANLVINLQTDADPGTGKEASIGYQFVYTWGPNSRIAIIADPFVPVGKAWLLDDDTWALYTVNKNLGFIETRGTPNNSGIVMTTTSDEVKIYMKAYYGLSCDAPGYNCSIVW